MSDEPPFEPARVVAALGAAGVAYVVVGGLAVAAHGVVRATADLDVVADQSGENMTCLAGCLTELGAVHPVHGRLTGDNLAAPVSFKLRTRHGHVQVLNRMPAVPPFRELAAARMIVELDTDALAPVCSLEHLLAMKRAAGRPRDLADLAELTELHGL